VHLTKLHQITLYSSSEKESSDKPHTCTRTCTRGVGRTYLFCGWSLTAKDWWNYDRGIWYVEE